MSLLTQLVEELNSGKLKVVDLTAPLGPDTPVIELPPIFGASPGVSIDVISHYDNKGPAWYWNTIRMGEHTGTHFDAPVHWITGKDLPDNATDTIPAKRFVGPACVIDVRADVAKNEDFLLTPSHLDAWEKKNGKIPARRVGVALHRLEQARRSRIVHQCAGRRPAQPGLSPGNIDVTRERPRRAGRWRRNDRHRCGPSGRIHAAVPESHDHARGGEVRAREPAQSRSACRRRGRW